MSGNRHIRSAPHAEGRAEVIDCPNVGRSDSANPDSDDSSSEDGGDDADVESFVELARTVRVSSPS